MTSLQYGLTRIATIDRYVQRRKAQPLYRIDRKDKACARCGAVENMSHSQKYCQKCRAAANLRKIA